jgi:cysteinyl-tRNA synthetase
MKEGAGGFGPNERRGTEEKENSRDFALWKAFNPLDGEVVWNTNWGKGRPGWHIECSAMCNCLLGPTIDIHAGGVDLVFPHHENELAQSEAYSDKPFCRYWIHNGFVNIDNEKMSKSLKNFKTLRDIAKNPFDARAFRFMVVSAQYRNPLNFSPETFNAACSSLKRIDKLIAQLIALKAKSASTGIGGAPDDMDWKAVADDALNSFEVAMCDDMNTPRGSAALFGLVKVAEKAIKENTLTQAGATTIIDAIECMDRVLGVCYDVPIAAFEASIAAGSGSGNGSGGTIGSAPQNVIELAQKRAEMKKLKQYKEADALRLEISSLGFEVKDSKDGFQLIPI